MSFRRLARFCFCPGALPIAVPCPAGLLRSPVPGKGRDPDRAGHQGPVEVLAKDLLTERSYVSRRDRRNSGRY